MYEGRLSSLEFQTELVDGNWLSLAGQFVNDTPASEKLLREETEYILAELTRRTS
jgi:hypothetical protein